MTLGGRNKKFTRRDWLDFGRYCGIPKKAAESILASQIDALEASIEIIGRSFLPAKKKEEYEKIVREHTDVLAAGAS